RETTCVQELLKCYNFRKEDFSHHHLPLQGERWDMDLFHPQALKDMGVHVGKGVAAGAMAGVTVDLFTGGLSLGAAALVGALAGGLWQGADRLGKRVMGRVQGFREITVDDAVLRLLALRQIALIRALQRRGHAARAPIVIDAELPPHTQPAGTPRHVSAISTRAKNSAPEPGTLTGSVQETLRSGTLPDQLTEARSRPEWSSLLPGFEEASTRREDVVRSLAQWLAPSTRNAA